MHFFRYYTLFSIPYIAIRNLYYYRYFEDKNKNDMLYTARLQNIIFNYPLFLILTPIYVTMDMQFIEKRIRRIPLDKEDIYIHFVDKYNYNIKDKYLEKK
jgi:hypothetical protein